VIDVAGTTAGPPSAPAVVTGVGVGAVGAAPPGTFGWNPTTTVGLAGTADGAATFVVGAAPVAVGMAAAPAASGASSLVPVADVLGGGTRVGLLVPAEIGGAAVVGVSAVALLGATAAAGTQLGANVDWPPQACSNA